MIKRTFAVGLLLGASQFAVYAQDAPVGKLHMQLNNAQTVAEGCQLTFALRNDTGTAIDRSAYNMAVVDGQQQVSTLITFEFRALPVGQTKVQQFAMAGGGCEQITGLVINDFIECATSEGPSLLCENNIEPSSKTAIAFPWELQIK